MSRDVTIFGRYWKATTFSSIVQPTIYLLAFGLGLGTLVHNLGGITYVQYVATGVVATAVLFSSAFPGMFNTFVRWQFQRTYDAMLAAPLDVEELITAEVLWISIRAGVYGVAPLLVALAFGLTPEPGMLLVPFIALPDGVRLRGVRRCDRRRREDDRQLQLRDQRRAHAAVPAGWHVLPDHQIPARRAHRRPVQPAVSLRPARAQRVAGQPGARRPYHAGVLLAFAVLAWRLAISQLGRRLID